MRAIFSFASILIVLGIVVVAVKHQLEASRQGLPAGSASTMTGPSAPFGGTSQPSVAQYQRELDRAIQEGVAARASAADAAEGSR
jgi:hypothetical protein